MVCTHSQAGPCRNFLAQAPERAKSRSPSPLSSRRRPSKIGRHRNETLCFLLFGPVFLPKSDVGSDSRHRFAPRLTAPLRKRRRSVGADGLTLCLKTERLRRQVHTVREREAACRRERYRVKNGHAGATKQFVWLFRENVLVASCFVCDRLWFTRDKARRNYLIISQSGRNIVKISHQLTLSIRITSRNLPRLCFPTFDVCYG